MSRLKKFLNKLPLKWKLKLAKYLEPSYQKLTADIRREVLSEGYLKDVDTYSQGVVNLETSACLCLILKHGPHGLSDPRRFRYILSDMRITANSAFPFIGSFNQEGGPLSVYQHFGNRNRVIFLLRLHDLAARDAEIDEDTFSDLIHPHAIYAMMRGGLEPFWS